MRQRAVMLRPLQNVLSLWLLLALALTGAGCALLQQQEEQREDQQEEQQEEQVSQPVGDTATERIQSTAMEGEAGVIVGEEMDAHAEEVDRDLTEAQVTKVEGPESGETAGFGVVFGSAHFRVNSDELRADALDELDVMIQSLRAHPGADVVIVGHTDASGPKSYNQRLSERRAGSAAAYMQEQGVDPGRVTLMSQGETDPIASNETERGRRKNRRVEIAVYASEERRQKAARQARRN